MPADRRAQAHPAGEGCDQRAASRSTRPSSWSTASPGDPGQARCEFEPDDIITAFIDLVRCRKASGARGGGHRREADFTTRTRRTSASAEGLRVRDVLPVRRVPQRQHRPRRRAVDGTMLKPGETFSLNGTVGERTVENGFTMGYVISGGIFKETTAAGSRRWRPRRSTRCSSPGSKDIEHKPHSFFIDRYPEGREATVAWPSVDLRFRTTPTTASSSTPGHSEHLSSQGVVTVQMYSTKVWDIRAQTGERYTYVAPGTRSWTPRTATPTPATPASSRRHPHLPQARRVGRRPQGELPHVVHPGRHGHLPPTRLPRQRRQQRRLAAGGSRYAPASQARPGLLDHRKE